MCCATTKHFNKAVHKNILLKKRIVAQPGKSLLSKRDCSNKHRRVSIVGNNGELVY